MSIGLGKSGTSKTDDELQESPLSELNLPAPVAEAEDQRAVTVCERPFQSIVDVRGDPENPSFVAAVRSALGIDLPASANSSASNDDITILWLGPDEWLVVSAPEQAAVIAETLSDALKHVTAAVTDVSDAYAVITLGGHEARDVLRKGTSLNLHPRAFSAGRCAKTLLQDTDVILHQKSEAPLYDIYVARSFSVHIWNWLEDASSEFAAANRPDERL